VNELERWANRSQSIIPSRDERAHTTAVRKIVYDARESKVKIDAAAAVTVHLMERAVDLDNHRRNLAGDDPTLNAVLTRIELGFVAKGEQYQRDFGSRF
jgi:hypothetical protein